MSNAITRKTHFGQVVQVEHQGAVVTMSMMRWGLLKKLMPTPFTFRPKYETAIFDGPSAAAPTKCICTFYYVDEATALTDWDLLVRHIEDAGLSGAMPMHLLKCDPAKVGLFINRKRQFAPVGVDSLSLYPVS